MEYLYKLEQMRPLSIWWIVLTLMALAVLLGPVDYLVLKWLDKLPYTWLTSTGWIVIFTVGAYFGVQWLRSGAMEVRAVSVLDGIADSNCAWATCYAGLFAPRSDDYRLGGLSPHQWWSGIAPTREEMWAFQRDTGMQQIHCVQVDGGNLPVSLPINIWTVQPLLSEWPLDRLPFAATVEHRAGRSDRSRSRIPPIARSSGASFSSRIPARTWDRSRPMRPSGSMCGPGPSGPGSRARIREPPNRRQPVRVKSGGGAPAISGRARQSGPECLSRPGLFEPDAGHARLSELRGGPGLCRLRQCPAPDQRQGPHLRCEPFQVARQLVLPKRLEVGCASATATDRSGVMAIPPYQLVRTSND